MPTVVREMRDAAKSSSTLGLVTALLGVVAIVAPLFSGAAAILGLHPNTLRARLRKLGLQRPSG